MNTETKPDSPTFEESNNLLRMVLGGLVQECEYSASSGLPFNACGQDWTQLRKSKELLTTLKVRSMDRFCDSPTWPYVLAFAKRMETKLEKNRHKGDREGWLNDKSFSLLRRILDEAAELRAAMDIAVVRMTEGESNARHAAENVADEAADVANFAMMLADWHIARVGWNTEHHNTDSAEME